MKIYEFRLIFHWSLFLRVQLMVTPSRLNHAPRRGQGCSVKHTTWQHPIQKEIVDIGLILARFCQKSATYPNSMTKTDRKKYENCILPVDLVKCGKFVKLGVKVFQGQSRNEASHVSHISVDDSSDLWCPLCLERKAIENMVFNMKWPYQLTSPHIFATLYYWLLINNDLWHANNHEIKKPEWK